MSLALLQQKRNEAQSVLTAVPTPLTPFIASKMILWRLKHSQITSFSIYYGPYTKVKVYLQNKAIVIQRSVFNSLSIYEKVWLSNPLDCDAIAAVVIGLIDYTSNNNQVVYTIYTYHLCYVIIQCVIETQTDKLTEILSEKTQNRRHWYYSPYISCVHIVEVPCFLLIYSASSLIQSSMQPKTDFNNQSRCNAAGRALCVYKTD